MPEIIYLVGPKDAKSIWDCTTIRGSLVCFPTEAAAQKEIDQCPEAVRRSKKKIYPRAVREIGESK